MATMNDLLFIFEDDMDAILGVIESDQDVQDSFKEASDSVIVTEPSIHVTPSDITMDIHESKNISISLKNPINETLYINFKYKPSGIIEELPANETLEAGAIGPLTYMIIPKKASKVVIQIETNEGIDSDSGRVNQLSLLYLCSSNVSHINSPSKMADTSKAYVQLKISNIPGLDILSTVIGWAYFVAWSFSFYPQIVLNYQRKSVIGLDFNFLTLNIVGFFCYSIFNIALFASPVIKAEYFAKNPYSINPVHINDIVFAVHAFVISVFTGFQCLIYDRGNQKVSIITKCIHVAIVIFLIISLILSVTSVINYYLYMQFFSYVKLFITIIKYAPQAVFNFVRKSTVGWSIGNILLDFTGGSLSMLQMFIDAYNYNSWGILFGDMTKFGLGLFSVLFDILFIIQHYCLYKNSRNSTYENMDVPDKDSHIEPTVHDAADKDRLC
ncbi:Cystinosin [Nymphon striatum]|nr:Cystinosin [Nymphon striatum]